MFCFAFAHTCATNLSVMVVTAMSDLPNFILWQHSGCAQPTHIHIYIVGWNVCNKFDYGSWFLFWLVQIVNLSNCFSLKIRACHLETVYFFPPFSLKCNLYFCFIYIYTNNIYYYCISKKMYILWYFHLFAVGQNGNGKKYVMKIN